MPVSACGWCMRLALLACTQWLFASVLQLTPIFRLSRYVSAAMPGLVLPRATKMSAHQEEKLIL